MAPETRVLVVDDEPDLLDLVQLDLELSGYEVIVARDGVQALERLRDERPDVVLLDVMMPRMDGWQVLARMRSDEALAEIPVVMLTALSSEVDRIRGQLSGAVQYVTKPFELPELLEAVSLVLRPPSATSRQERREEVSSLLQRLAELEAGRERVGDPVRMSRLESRRGRAAGPMPDDRRLAELTERQRQIAAMLAAGIGARAIAVRLGTSRANVYATRQRIARVLSVDPQEVAEVARAAGLASEAPAADDEDPR